MKKFFKTLFAVALIAVSVPAFVSCDDDDEPETVQPETIQPESGDDVQQRCFTYSAETTVRTIGVDGAYVNSGSTYVVELSEDATVADLTINNAKFAERMPPLTMQFKGIAVAKADGDYVLNCGELIPEIAGTPYPGYLITELTGQFNDGAGSLRFTCAGIYEVEVTFLQQISE